MKIRQATRGKVGYAEQALRVGYSLIFLFFFVCVCKDNAAFYTLMTILSQVSEQET